MRSNSSVYTAILINCMICLMPIISNLCLLISIWFVFVFCGRTLVYLFIERLENVLLLLQVEESQPSSAGILKMLNNYYNGGVNIIKLAVSKKVRRTYLTQRTTVAIKSSRWSCVFVPNQTIQNIRCKKKQFCFVWLNNPS